MRTVDGADRPILVERVYALWSANVENRSSSRVVTYDILTNWPAPGRAWEAFQSDIQTLMQDGSLVMCSNTDPSDHPEHHLTQGHEGHKPFVGGKTPMVLRYLATPAGSIAWRRILDDRESSRKATQARKAEAEEQLREAVYSLAAVKPRTEGALTRKLSAQRGDVVDAVISLARAGRLTVDGKTFWGATRWRAVELSNPSEQADS